MNGPGRVAEELDCTVDVSICHSGRPSTPLAEAVVLEQQRRGAWHACSRHSHCPVSFPPITAHIDKHSASANISEIKIGEADTKHVKVA